MTSLRKNMTTGNFEVSQDGTLLASFADYWTAHLAFDATPDSEPTPAIDPDAAEAMERDNLIDDLCVDHDPSDLDDLSIEQLRAMASQLN